MVNTLSLLSFVSGAIAATFTVEVGQGGQDTYTPSTVTAAVGDIVTFKFDSLHDVAQGPYDSPCLSHTEGGIYSGIMSSGEFSIKINNTDPIWYYCSVGSHCQNGMVGVINPPSSGETLSSYSSAAASASGRSVAGNGVSGGIVGSNSASLFGESGSSSSSSSASGAASSGSATSGSASSSANGSTTPTSSTGTTPTSSGATTATSSGAADHVKAFGYAGVAAIVAAIMA
ncbi:hypothetical protein FKW77_006575 [Venturia effusa]|uniref:Phytocyanin domain-containing protein n=1 Tax=Venturia effusa TaxID=50376 RepID=A0A517LDX4_9PEZI|nr:hypothetical protein FKW77_006575 [Venturia effusa]